jgi:hypothetical protein
MDSMGRNRLVDVTGLLLTHEGWFLQALEGPTPAVEALLAKISSDTRHRGLRILHAGPAQARMFEDWNMTDARLGPETEPLLTELGQLACFDAHALDSAAALQLLSMAAEGQRRRERAALGLTAA